LFFPDVHVSHGLAPHRDEDGLVGLPPCEEDAMVVEDLGVQDGFPHLAEEGGRGTGGIVGVTLVVAAVVVVVAAAAVDRGPAIRIVLDLEVEVPIVVIRGGRTVDPDVVGVRVIVLIPVGVLLLPGDAVGQGLCHRIEGGNVV